MKGTHLVIATMFLLGCASPPPVTVPSPCTDCKARNEEEFDVGTARVDLTPPPGVSTFGLAPDAHATDGYWSRLYCRVFFFRSRTDLPLAIIPCDLAATSAALHHKVADKVRQLLPRARILIASTHTHAGPAHYFESDAYSGAASTRRPGFDEAMLELLASRIAKGIEQASETVRPSALRWEHGPLWGLTRNRSLIPFLANIPRFPATPPADLSPEQQAIDPHLDVLRIDQIDRSTGESRGPIGLLVFFAMHPTVLPSSNRQLGADVFGVTSRALEANLRQVRALANDSSPPDPLAGIVNTNEGDISPVWVTGTVTEARAVGEKFAESIWRTYEPKGSLKSAVVIDSRYLEADLAGATLLRGGELCKKGELGQGTGHGGSDHPTTIDGLLPGGSDRDPTRKHCQAPKAELLGVIQPLLIGHHSDRYPEHVSFSLVRLDDTWISFVPAELTVHAGWHVDTRVRSIVEPTLTSNAHFVVGGLTNGYIQYVTTRAEYDFQNYEGASTLYGPLSAEFIAERLEILARSMRGEDANQYLAPKQPRVGEAVDVDFRFGPSRSRLASPADGLDLVDVPGRGPLALCSIKEVGDSSALCFSWRDGSPGRVTMSNTTGAPWVELVNADGSQVPLCQRRGNVVLCDPLAHVDDLGLDFQTRIQRRDGSGFTWSTLFRPTAAEWKGLPGIDLELRIRGNGHAPAVLSAPFSRSKPPAPCSTEVELECLHP